MNHSTFITASMLTMLMLVGSASAQPPAAATKSSAKQPAVNDSTLAWSQWRGPNRDGLVPAGSAKWPATIDKSNFTELWRKELESSYSGPIVSSQLVFTTETRGKKTEWVTAFDRKSGEQKWEASWEGAMSVPFFAKANGDWIRSTPAFDGESIFVAGIRDVLVCLDATNGKERWRIDFVEKYGSKVPDFGCVCSPMINAGHVYVQAGASFFKIDKSNGNVVWRSLNDGGGMMGSAFSSPVIAELNGKRQLIVQTRSSLVGIDDQSGEVLWSKEIQAFRGMNILTPTVVGESVFTSAYGGSAQLFDINKTNDQFAVSETWQSGVTAYMSSPIVINEHLYMHLRNQRFTCIDLKTGESKWTPKPFGKYWSMIANGDQILALDNRGDLLLIQSDADSLKILDQQKVADDSWAHLAIQGDLVIVRDLAAIKVFRWK